MSPPLWKHQEEGVKALVAYLAFMLADEPRTGKSRQVVEAATRLFAANKIDTVVVIAPAQARSTWTDPEIGEVVVHGAVPTLMLEFHGEVRTVWSNENPALIYCVSNYEILRSTKHLQKLINYLRGRSTLLVLDESHLVKNRNAAQTKAIRELRSYCQRCVALTGTPGNPLEMWSQLRILDEKILGQYKNFWHFRANFATMGGFKNKQVLPNGWHNMDEFHSMTKPYVLRRKKEDVLDLPPRLFLTREIPLTKMSWDRYRQFRRDAVIEISQQLHMEPNGAVKLMRLSQLCGGAIGGDEGTQDLSSEKIDFCVNYILNECTALAVIVWARFRRERERLAEKLRASGMEVHEIYGGQKKAEREIAKKVFNARSKEITTRNVLIGQPGAGGVSIDMAQASEVIRFSSDFSHTNLIQSDDRPFGPGQKNTLTYIDLIATGIKGEKTIDSTVVKALRRKEDLAKWTSAAWRKELE